MKNIVQLVREHRFIEAEDQIDNAIPLIMEKKLFEMKKAVAAKMCEQMKSASEKIRGELTEDEKEEHLDEMQIGKSSGMSNIAKDMRLSQEPEWTKTNDNLKGYRNPEPRLPDADPRAFKSNTPTHSIVPNKKTISKYIKPNLEEESTEEELEENYHPSYTSAIQTAVKHAEKRGYKVDPEDYDNKVATGHRKPSEGKTIFHVLRLTKDGKESKKTLAVQIYNRGGNKTPFELNHYISEDVDNIDEARINIVRARVRGGKVQRRKKVSNVAGMTMRGGTLKRMSAAERRRRKMGARKGKVKRRAKLSRSLMKRKRSLQKRKSLGL